VSRGTRMHRLETGEKPDTRAESSTALAGRAPQGPMLPGYPVGNQRPDRGVVSGSFATIAKWCDLFLVPRVGPGLTGPGEPGQPGSRRSAVDTATLALVLLVVLRESWRNAITGSSRDGEPRVGSPSLPSATERFADRRTAGPLGGSPAFRLESRALSPGAPNPQPGATLRLACRRASPGRALRRGQPPALVDRQTVRAPAMVQPQGPAFGSIVRVDWHTKIGGGSLAARL
jgi:hypothetical protein